jgi:predicted ABC-type ATPase
VLHVLLIPEELAVRRVAYRVRAGGHPVAENKIRERYRRLWALLAAAIPRCEQATVYDNSGIKGPRIVAQMTEGLIVGSPTWPDWTPQALSAVADVVAAGPADGDADRPRVGHRSDRQ